MERLAVTSHLQRSRLARILAFLELFESKPSCMWLVYVSKKEMPCFSHFKMVLCISGLHSVQTAYKCQCNTITIGVVMLYSDGYQLKPWVRYYNYTAIVIDQNHVLKTILSHCIVFDHDLVDNNFTKTHDLKKVVHCHWWILV